MSKAALLIICHLVLCGLGFLFAFYISLIALDPPEAKKICERVSGNGYFASRARQQLLMGEMLTVAVLIRHWRSRPQVRRMLVLAVVFLSLAAATAAIDALLQQSFLKHV